MPITATILQAVVMWVWHVPALFDRALASQGWHVAQHLCFIASSLLFWAAMIDTRRNSYLLSAACLFVTSLVEGALGALMALSVSPWYSAYAAMALSGIGLDPTSDQQLAGLIMWIPGDSCTAARRLACSITGSNRTRKAVAFLRTKTAAGLIGGAVILAATAGAAFDFVSNRDAMWSHAAAATGGDPHRGEAMFIQYGCGSCHGLKHVRKASGTVGPPLDGIAIRAIIAGKLDNTPAHLQTWIRHPQRISPGTAMPDLQVGERDARDISAFLYTRAE